MTRVCVCVCVCVRVCVRVCACVYGIYGVYTVLADPRYDLQYGCVCVCEVLT
jgi:hypothetical protein